MMQHLLVLGAALAAVVSAAVEPARVPHQPLGSRNGQLLNINITTLAPGPLRASTTPINWVGSADKDGLYITQGSDGFIFTDVVTQNTTTFLAASKIPQDYQEYWISSDYKKVLWAINSTKQYRYSYFADYLVQVGSGRLKGVG